MIRLNPSCITSGLPFTGTAVAFPGDRNSVKDKAAEVSSISTIPVKNNLGFPARRSDKYRRSRVNHGSNSFLNSLYSVSLGSRLERIFLHIFEVFIFEGFPSGDQDAMRIIITARYIFQVTFRDQ